MAFENGRNAFNYCENEFLSYKKDQFIFVKALQSLQYFQTRNDFPYCIDDMDLVFTNLLGTPLTAIAYGTSKYILGFCDELDWDIENVVVFDKNVPKGSKSLCSEMEKTEIDELSKRFKNEYHAFIVTIRPFIDSLFYGQRKDKQLSKILRDSSFGKNFSLRLIREDDEYFDITVCNEDLDKLCNSILEIKKDV